MSELNHKCTGSSKVTDSNNDKLSNDKMSTCENFESFRDLNNPKNGICILGEFSGIHRGLCWCDLVNIDVKKEVPLSCIVCLMNEKLTYGLNPVPNLEFSDFINVIFEQELEKIDTGFYDIDCGLPEKQLIECEKKFYKVYDGFMNDLRNMRCQEYIG